jgi:hypothetical protein
MKKSLIFICLLFSNFAYSSDLMVELTMQYRQHFTRHEVYELGHADIIIPVQATDLSYQIIDVFNDLWLNISEDGVRYLHTNSSSETWVIDNNTRNDDYALYVVISNRKVEGYIASLSKCQINGCAKNQGVIYLDKFGTVVKLYMNR